jgi:plastocyanin
MAIFGALLLTALWALGDVMTKQNTDAQKRGAMGADNMTSGGLMTMKPGDNTMIASGKNITSSINLMNIIHQAIGSKINVSLSEAAIAAEGIGNNSRAVVAYLEEENRYLVYDIIVMDTSMNFSKVIVDPGNGHLLFSKQLSKEDMMKDEMERHHKMMSMMMGPQQGGGMMMGPMNQGMMMGGGHDMMMGPQQGGGMMMGPQQGGGMMMGPVLTHSQQTGNATSTNATSTPSTTNATTNATSPAAVVSTSRPGATTTVSMAQGSQAPNNPEFYVPAEITVKPGQTVTWKNDDTAIHTATSGQDVTPDGRFDTSFVYPGQSSKPIAMPTQLGQYPYFCTLHPWMIGTVIVG